MGEKGGSRVAIESRAYWAFRCSYAVMIMGRGYPI